MEYLNMSLLQIYHRVCQRQNFENWLTIGEVMGRNLMSCFFDSRCIVLYYGQVIAKMLSSTRNHIVVPVAHMFINNEICLPLLRASLLFDRYSLPIPMRVGG